MPCSGRKVTLICSLNALLHSGLPPVPLLGLLFPPIRLQGQVCLILSDASVPIPHSTHRSACHVGPHADWCSECVCHKGTNQEGANSEAPDKQGLMIRRTVMGRGVFFPPGSYKKCPSPATSRLVLLVYGPDGGGCDEESTRAGSGLQFRASLLFFLSFFFFFGFSSAHPSCHFLFLSNFFFSPACFFLFGCDLVGLPCRRLTNSTCYTH
ncbi:hypothetical protein ASPBRDRAFT_675621 [Aspergillus brasiliensis CBS 101740]|uniref:Uncharacterized protein n=1 Tax=Aspergillus brasiliensis (strain CBS 101740 / IMI 381727 / IBT 21946) TaxID=767769 RepID=A0A1L9UH09_ASPBC|nr:hypothetical protein ASPBRDRAFT_675621 [Aspergillus brasiliensis CBS 101740]